MFLVLDKKFVLGTSAVLLAVLLITFSAFDYKTYIPVSLSDTKRVVIDPGHGGVDGGSVSVNGDAEKDINLEISLELKKIFEANGYSVIMTRSDDYWLSENSEVSIRKQKNSDLRKRAEIANEANAGLFISVHINQYESPEIFGAQTFYSKNDEQGKAYAESIMEQLRTLNSRNKRLAKIHPNKNFVFQNLKIPGVLVECGFISNPDDLKELKNNEYQKKLAKSIYDGIVDVKEIGN